MTTATVHLLLLKVIFYVRGLFVQRKTPLREHLIFLLMLLKQIQVQYGVEQPVSPLAEISAQKVKLFTC